MDGWILTERTLVRDDGSSCRVSIDLATYPEPRCYEVAAEFDAKREEMRLMRVQERLAVATKSKPKAMAKAAAMQEVMEL